MFGSTLVEVGLGLFATYALLSLLATAIMEALAAFTQVRGRFLSRQIEAMLADPSVREAFYRHPYINWATGRSRSAHPQYISSGTFVKALLNAVPAADSAPGDTGNPLDSLREAVNKIDKDSPLRNALTTAIDSADGQLERVRANITEWFDVSMERVTEQYKRHVRWVLLGVGLVLAVALNADTLRIFDTLANNPAVRQQAAAGAMALAMYDVAAARVNEPQPPRPVVEEFERNMARLSELGVPLGWNKTAWQRVTSMYFVLSVFGWLLTAFAISLGAPFWFDLIAKLSPLRSVPKGAAASEPNP